MHQKRCQLPPPKLLRDFNTINKLTPNECFSDQTGKQPRLSLQSRCFLPVEDGVARPKVRTWITCLRGTFLLARKELHMGTASTVRTHTYWNRNRNFCHERENKSINSNKEINWLSGWWKTGERKAIQLCFASMFISRVKKSPDWENTVIRNRPANPGLRAIPTAN